MKVQGKPVEVKLGYAPMPKQGKFHGLDHKYRFFAGGWGNGKTSAGCAEAFMLAMEYPGCTGLIARKTRPELKATTQDQFFNGGGSGLATDWPGCPEEVIRSFNKSEQRLTFINNSIIHFWPLDEPGKLTNLNLGWFLIDQGEEIPEEMFMMLQGRLRQRIGPRKGMVLCNQNGHDWIWRRLVHLEGAYPDHGLVHAKTTDNKNLPSDYIDTLMHMPKIWIKRFVEGSWDVFEGQIWPEFVPEIHVIQPFTLPDNWEIVEGIDHGKRNPTAVLWTAFDEYGNCFVVDEHYMKGQLVGVHAEAILEKRGTFGEPQYTVIDASAGNEDPVSGRSVIDEYWDYGITCFPSDRHVPARVSRVGEWLRMRKHRLHPRTQAQRDEGYPSLYIFANCLNLIEHIQTYQWKKQPVTQDEDPKEQPLKKDDHDVDALGYILMTRPPPASPSLKGSPTGDPRTDAYWERIRDRMEGRSSGGVHSRLGSEG